MSKGTAPAWQARDIARGKVLEQIKQAIESMEDEFENRLDLYRLVLSLIDTQLSSGALSMSFMGTLPSIPWKTRRAAYDVLLSADAIIGQFQRAPEEGNTLWAKIFEWTAAQISASYYSVLQALEGSEPEMIYGVADCTTEVPFE